MMPALVVEYCDNDLNMAGPLRARVGTLLPKRELHQTIPQKRREGSGPLQGWAWKVRMNHLHDYSSPPTVAEKARYTRMTSVLCMLLPMLRAKAPA